MNKFFLFAALAMPGIAMAQSADPIVTAPESGSVALSISQTAGPGSTLVVDSRPVTLPAGRARLRFENLAATRVEGSLQIALPAGHVLQLNNVAADEASLGLLGKSIGQRVTVRVPNQPPLTGTLRQATPYVVIENAEGVHVVSGGAASYFSLERLPTEAAPHAGIEALVDGPGTTGQAELRYLASGLGWSANYGATFIGDRLSFKSWVTVANTSTANFRSAQVSLASATTDTGPAFALPGRVDLPAGQSRSFVLADLDNAAFTSDIVWSTQSLESADTSGRPRLTLTLKEPAAVALPAGSLTVYGTGTNGAPLLISSGTLGPFYKGSDIRLALGETPFIGVRRTVTQRRLNPKTREFIISFTLDNRSPAAVAVRLVEPIAADSKVTASSQPASKSQSGNLEFLVNVPAKDNATFSYTVERPN